MRIKMQRDYKPSYKYGWMSKGNTYDTDKIPQDVLTKEKAQGLVDSGYAVIVKGIFGIPKKTEVVELKESPVVKKKEEVKVEEKKEKNNDIDLARVREEAKERKAKKNNKETEIVVGIGEDLSNVEIKEDDNVGASVGELEAVKE